MGTFRWVDAGNGQIALQAVANDRYVTTGGAGVSPLIANRDIFGPWQAFIIALL